MKLMLERHAYAPELNRMYRVRRNGDLVLLARAGSGIGQLAFDSIKSYRQARPALKPFIHAVIKTHYNDPALKWLERTHSGRVGSRKEAIAFAREKTQQLAPGGTLTIQTRLIG